MRKSRVEFLDVAQYIINLRSGERFLRLDLQLSRPGRSAPPEARIQLRLPKPAGGEDRL